MSSDDYQVQNIYRYSRKSFKKNRRGQDADTGSQKEDEIAESSPRVEPKTDGMPIDAIGCSCDADPDGDIASILHKKCPVINLAQQQLQRLLDGTDKLLCDNTRCCKSLYDFICLCKEICGTEYRGRFLLVLCIAVAFVLGLLFGAGSCGNYLGQFNSPIFACIDTYFMQDNYPTIKESFRSIA